MLFYNCISSCSEHIVSRSPLSVLRLAMVTTVGRSVSARVLHRRRARVRVCVSAAAAWTSSSLREGEVHAGVAFTLINQLAPLETLVEGDTLNRERGAMGTKVNFHVN